jgi:hypothetical protein
VNLFWGATIDGRLIVPCAAVKPGHRQVLGAKVHNWGNGDLTPEQIADALAPRLRVIAQKTWASRPLTSSYRRFEGIMRTLGHVPGYGRPR